MPFSDIMHHAMIHALRASSLPCEDPAFSEILEYMDNIPAFNDVIDLVDDLNKEQGWAKIHAAMLSNGGAGQLETTFKECAPLGLHKHCFKDVVCAEAVGKYKPAKEVYRHLADKLGVGADMGRINLVSANPFDIAGANAVGMATIWVDREGGGWQDQLLLDRGADGKPDWVVNGLSDLVDKVIAGRIGGKLGARR